MHIYKKIDISIYKNRYIKECKSCSSHQLVGPVPKGPCDCNSICRGKWDHIKQINSDPFVYVLIAASELINAKKVPYHIQL